MHNEKVISKFSLQETKSSSFPRNLMLRNKKWRWSTILLDWSIKQPVLNFTPKVNETWNLMLGKEPAGNIFQRETPTTPCAILCSPTLELYLALFSHWRIFLKTWGRGSLDVRIHFIPYGLFKAECPSVLTVRERVEADHIPGSLPGRRRERRSL